MTAEEIVSIIKSSGITQRALAKKTGLSITYLSEFMNGKRIFDRSQMAILETFCNKLKAIL